MKAVYSLITTSQLLIKVHTFMGLQGVVLLERKRCVGLVRNVADFEVSQDSF